MPARPAASSRRGGWRRLGSSLAGGASSGAAGQSLLELLVALLVLALAAGLSLPSLHRWQQRQSLRGLAFELAVTAAGLKAGAAATGRHRGLRFDPSADDLVWLAVADGDGDGLRRSDIDRGIDPVIGGPSRLAEHQPGLLPGLPRGVDPIGGGAAGRHGVAFGRSALLSFAPDGSATAGTLYLSNRNGEAAALRCYGPTGRVSIWWHDEGATGWKRLR